MEDNSLPIAPVEPGSTEQPPLPVEHEKPQKSYYNKSNWKKWLLIYIIIGIIVYGIVYYFYFYKKATNPYAINSLYTSPTVPPTQNTDDEANWSTYEIDAVHLKFKLPPELSQNGTITEKIIPGNTGSQLLVSFPNQQAFLIGTTSPNYSAPRDGTFLDREGFKIENGKYYARFINNQYNDLEIYNPKLIQNPSGVTILKVISSKKADGQPLLSGNLVGALINIPNSSTYPGIAIQAQLSDRLTENLFDQILSTFQFTNQTHSTNTSTLKTLSYDPIQMQYPSSFTVQQETKGYSLTDGATKVTVVNGLVDVSNNETTQDTVNKLLGSKTSTGYTKVAYQEQRVGGMFAAKVTDASKVQYLVLYFTAYTLITITPASSADLPAISTMLNSFHLNQ